MSEGANCANTTTGEMKQIGLDEYIDFLKIQTEPSRPGAVCMSFQDFDHLKTSIEVACRMLGKRCTYEQKKVIENIESFWRINMMH